MKRLLEFDDDYDFSLLGISSHVKDYRLCWEINREMELFLEKAEPIVSQVNQDTIAFSTHECFLEDDHLTYHLISNKNSGRVLVPEYPQLDYFLKVSGSQHELETEELKNRIQNIEVVLTVLQIEIKELKSKINLVF